MRQKRYSFDLTGFQWKLVKHYTTRLVREGMFTFPEREQV